MRPSPSSFLRSFVWLSFSLCILASSACAQQVAAQQVAVQPRITQPVDDAQLTRLPGNTHPLALARFDRGAAPLTLPLDRMLLVLKRSPEQDAVLLRLLDEQQDKSSPNYHKWLTPEEFGKRFGPADADIQAVTSWLQTHGFQIGQVSKGRTVIEFSGTAAMVQEAFHTQIHKYVVGGEPHWANASDPQIPNGLAPVVAGINTLHNFARKAFSHPVGEVSRSKETGIFTPSQPLFTLPVGGCGVQPSNCYAVGPYDFATIYGVAPLWSGSPAIDGTGETIAIVGETDINPQDVADFRNFFGLPAANLQVFHNGPAPGILQNGEEAEALLDVEWSGAVAKGATIDFVVTESTESSLGVDLSAQYVVDNNLAPIMSESYGECELAIGTTGNQFFNQLWQQAAAQGITVFLASGDSGSAVCDSQNATPPSPAQFGLQVSGFSSTPYNVSVGGTDFYDWTTAASYWTAINDSTTKASALKYVPETTWNNTCTNGVLGALLGFSTDPETNCNNSRLVNAGFVQTVAGSGGKSACTTSDGQHASSCSGGNAKPAWQTALTPHDGRRDMPDISLFAAVGSPSGSFYVICESDKVTAGTSCNSNDASTRFFAIGGTSASSPAMAGIMALVNQKNGDRQGNANYVFYKLAAQQQPSACNSTNGSGSSCVFNDVTNGTIAMPCLQGSPNCTVAHSGDQYGVLAGYAAGTGYDLATGLGSVNAANLVNKWSSVTFTQSATTLNGVSPATLTHGQSATVTVTVAPTSGTGAAPTGAISLTRGPNSTDPGIESHALANGTATWSTMLLPGGTYSLSAHYDGDGVYGPSDSGPFSVTVNKENSQTLAFLVTFDPITGAVRSPSTTSAQYGSPYLLRMNVANSAGASCPPFRQLQASCPSGNIILTDSGAPLDGGQFALNTVGYAEDFQVQLSGGAHTVVASYAGDDSYKASSANVVFSIPPAGTTLDMPILSSGFAQVGNPEQISTTVRTQSSGAAPTGTIQFSANGIPLSDAVSYTYSPASSAGPANTQATLSHTFTSAGTYNITATYSGDTNYSASTAGGVSLSLKYPQPTVYMQASSYSLQAGQSLTLTTQVITSVKNVAPTGTIVILQGTSGLQVPGTVTYSTIVDGNGNTDLQAVLTFTPFASTQFTAAYSGDTNYPGGQGDTGNITVSGTDFNLTPLFPSLTVKVGSYGQLFMAVEMQSDTSPVTFTDTTCSGVPKEATCSVAPSAVTYTSQAQIDVGTTGPHALAARPATTSTAIGWGISTFGSMMIGLLLLGNRTGSRKATALASIVLVAFLLAMAGCGGSGSAAGSGGGGGGGGGGVQIDPGTPPGTYTVTVTGTRGTTSHSTTFTLIVQK